MAVIAATEPIEDLLVLSSFFIHKLKANDNVPKAKSENPHTEYVFALQRRNFCMSAHAHCCIQFFTMCNHISGLDTISGLLSVELRVSR